MIKKLPNFLSKDELKLAQQYWTLKEYSLAPCLQAPNAFSLYADFLSETFLVAKKDVAEKALGESLLSAYSFSRVYYYASKLLVHHDRPSCEVSISLNIDADREWPLWFHELGEDEKPLQGQEACPLTLKPGEGCLYEGFKYDHWRETYKGKRCMQVFLHYVRKNGKYTSFAKDGRQHFGQSLHESTKNVWK